ncbi:MAG TPA: hypothetical protein VIL32_03695 [Steroidobacteraceae bacterium]
MLTLKQNAGRALLLGLVAAILVTRVDHFGTSFTPPDVTLAAMFLAGVWLRSVWGFVALLAAAGLADQIAFQQGVSDWCMSPAYPFLIPTYACLWLAGVGSRRLEWRRPQDLALGAVAFLVATTAAFVISSGSFFLLAEYFAEVSAADYWRTTFTRYFPYYLGWAALYSAAGLAIAAVVVGANAHRRAAHAAQRAQ